MKNMRLSTRLISSFLVVIALAVLVGGAGIFGMSRINAGNTELYERQLVPMKDLAYARETFQRLRSEQRNLCLAVGDAVWLDQIGDSTVALERSFHGYMEAFRGAVDIPDIVARFDVAYDGFYLYMQATDEIMAASRRGEDQSALIAMMKAATPAAMAVTDNFAEISNMRIEAAEGVYKSNNSLYHILLIVVIAAILIAVSAALILALKISGYITKPLGLLTDFMETAGATGDISLRPEHVKSIERSAQAKDELGRCMKGVGSFISHIGGICKTLEQAAGGDLAVDAKPLSDKDALGNALSKMVGDFNLMLREMQEASNQVSAGADQVSNSAQSLATGSSEQAASIEELDTALAQLMQMIKQEELSSESALKNSAAAANLMDNSREAMQDMMGAMKSIDESAKAITKVIKVIDDIAFQTNILALNAAVEAARAGQHGKGFAVVADEVRNLAAKSSAAAKETAALIEGDVQHVQEGTRAVTQAVESMESVGNSITQNTKIIADIAESTKKQSEEVVLINKGVEQISAVAQANAATAEQSSAASQELSAQSHIMNEISARFKLREQGSFVSSAANHQPDRPEGFSLSAGKY